MTSVIPPIPSSRALRLLQGVVPVVGRGRRMQERRQNSPQQDDTGASVVDAQILGQPQQKRGLRSGPGGLIKARSAYLSAKWSGASDRRNMPAF